MWQWLTDQYEQLTAGIEEQPEKNRIFRDLLTKAVDYEPLGVRKLPEQKR